ncbi:MAG: DUF721 domain-containing protein [Synechococcales cyanobacterium]
MMLHPLQTLLSSWQSLPQQRQWQVWAQIQTHWPTLVGTVVAQHTQPTHLKQQVLHVATSTSAWAQNLGFQRPLILTKLNALVPSPKIQDIHFSTAQWLSQGETSLLLPPMPSKRRRLPPNPLPAPTPQEAFQRWAHTLKHHHVDHPHCPYCQAPTPATELSRWGMCWFCHQT